MTENVKTPKSVYLMLGAGFAVGAISMAGIYGARGISVSKALAASPTTQVRTISAPNRESLAEMRNLDSFYTNLAEFVLPAVVDIQATSGRQMGTSGERMPISGGEGSGFILRSDGYIVTNDHVVAGFDNVKVILKDGREFTGKVTRAHDSDIAVVKIDAKNLPTLAFGDSNKIKPGQMAMACGSPFGLEQSVTYGHISALGRDKTLIEGRYYPDMIQTDTAINMGNSGGPLCNIEGQVVGLNTAIYSPSGTSAGIGFAIPSNQVRLIVDKLIEGGKVTRAQIGVIPENLTDYQKQQKHVTGGALVKDAPENGPAGKAGIKKEDVVIRVGHTQVNTQLDLRNAMLEYPAGSSVDVEVIRDGEHKTFKVKLEAHKDVTEQVNQFQGGGGNSQQFNLPKGFDVPDFFKDFPGTGNRRQKSNGTPAPQNDGKAHLGVKIGNLTDEIRSQYSIPTEVKGAIVITVDPGSVAESLDIQPGDIIQMLGGTDISSSADLTNVMAGIKPGDSKRIKFTRYSNGATMSTVRDVQF